MDQTTQHSSLANPLRLGASHGYRIDGDLASLNAELSASDAGGAAARSWALQLWACDEPYAGGALAGVKVAEAPISLPHDVALANTQLGAEAFAHIPAAQRDYAMVLVLASGAPGAFDQVHDFANYPSRQRFIAPHLSGAVGYRTAEDGGVILSGQRIVNPRAAGNLSGSLSLQLWALPEAYRGGQLHGELLASSELGRVWGQTTLELSDQWLALRAPADRAWRVALVLCEWTAAGYLTRDYCNFSEPYAGPFALVAEAPVVAPPVSEPVTASSVEPASEPMAPAVPKLASAAATPAVVKPASAATPAKLKPATTPAAPAEAPAKKRVASVVSEPEAPVLVSVHAASAEELARVPGINKKLAAEIVKARPFKSLEDLARVRGIGDKLIRNLRTLLKL